MVNIFHKIANLIYSGLSNSRQMHYDKLYITTGKNKAKVQGRGEILNPLDNKDNLRIGTDVLIDGIVKCFNTGAKIYLGDRVYVGPNSRIWAYDSILIGNNVLISHNCNIFDSNCHPTDYLARRYDYENILHYGSGNQNGEVTCATVILEDDVWIGANSCIMKGVTIGARSIVAAGSVVVKNVPEDVIVAGNPAAVVKKLENNNFRRGI